MPKTKSHKISHRMQHAHTKKRAAHVGVKTKMEFEMVFDRSDLPMLRRAIKLLEGKRK